MWIVIGIVAYIILMALCILFMMGCKRGRIQGDKAAAKHFGYEYKEEG